MPRLCSIIEINYGICYDLTMKLIAGLVVGLLLLVVVQSAQAALLKVPEDLRVESLECSQDKYHVNIAWDPVEFATSYRFYSRVKDGQYSSYDEVGKPSYRLAFNPEVDFYVAVSSVNTFTGNPPQVLESDLSAEYLVSIPKSLFDLCPQAVGESLPAREALLVESSDPEATSSIKKESLMVKDQSEQLEEQVLAQFKPTPTPLPIQKIIINFVNFLQSFFRFEP